MRLLLCGETRMEWAMPRTRLTMPSSVRATGASARTTGTATRTSPPPCAPPLPVAGRWLEESQRLPDLAPRASMESTVSIRPLAHSCSRGYCAFYTPWLQENRVPLALYTSGPAMQTIMQSALLGASENNFYVPKACWNIQACFKMVTSSDCAWKKMDTVSF